jgi:hypothetical protein
MKKDEITVREFKMWISGVEEMQEKGWTPNSTQWNKIKTKISQLTEEVIEYQPEKTTMHQREPQVYPDAPQWPVPPVKHHGYSSLDALPVHDIAYMNSGYQTDFL